MDILDLGGHQPFPATRRLAYLTGENIEMFCLNRYVHIICISNVATDTRIIFSVIINKAAFFV